MCAEIGNLGLHVANWLYGLGFRKYPCGGNSTLNRLKYLMFLNAHKMLIYKEHDLIYLKAGEHSGKYRMCYFPPKYVLK